MRISASQSPLVAEAASVAGGGLSSAMLKLGTPRNKRLRVLLVEDDEGDLYLVRRALAADPRVGDVMVARDGLEALDLITRWSSAPDLAIVDLHMPRKDGFELLGDLAAKSYVRFPAVVLSSSQAGEDIRRAKKRGAVQFLTKPNSVEKLTRALHDVISKLN